MITSLMLIAYIPSLLWFLITKRTPKLFYILHRRLFVRTNGSSNDMVSSLYSRFIQKYELANVNGVLGELNNDRLQHIVEELDHNGYYKFDILLDVGKIESLESFARSEPARILALDKKIGFTKEEYIFDIDNPLAPKYSYNGDRLLTSEVINDIVFDESLLMVAQEYLKTKPILDAISLWWSAPFKGKGTSGAAQEYHFDMDRIKFIKFFFYLSDVHVDSGPHCYIPGSHKKLPEKLRKDRRLADDEVSKYYETALEICGKKGTILAVDTRGLHKGKPLTKDYRLLLQLEYTNSLFGQEYPHYNTQYKDKLTAASAKYPRTYQLIS